MKTPKPPWCPLFTLWLLPLVQAGLGAPATPLMPTEADLRLYRYFESEVAQLEQRAANLLQTAGDWGQTRTMLRQQAAEMLGLHPMPQRHDLQPVVTGVVEHDDIVVEKLHFQSLPRLYITANLYRPKHVNGRLPAVLYVCGHGPVVTNQVSYGNKVSYQHHGVWFAQHGYLCLIMDTVQWGEILGVHHGTYRLDMWWWNARGYSPAGVETWNGIRALDYLFTRPDVDTNRLALTGRSGGGAYSWFIAALDDRVKVVAPVAGVTDLRNHILTGCIEGHCDCMFFVNTYRWDYSLLAVLPAPRPLLLVNTDSDTIFPLDGVIRVDAHVRRLYQQLKRPQDYGLVIGPGPHRDTQNLQIPVFRWFNHYLKKEEPLIDRAATKPFTPQQLKVFETLPSDAVNSNIHALFVPPATPPPPPASPVEWDSLQHSWLQALKNQSFAGWPTNDTVSWAKVASAKHEGWLYEAYEITPQPHVVLRLYTLQRPASQRPRQMRLWVRSDPLLPDKPTPPALPPAAGEALAAFAHTPAASPPPGELWLALYPRGTGPEVWSGDTRKQIHLRRRFMLLGQTLEGMRVWDIRQTLLALNQIKAWQSLPLTIEAKGSMAVNVLYAAALLPQPSNVGRPLKLVLQGLPASHHQGPDYLNVLKVLDLPQALLLALPRCDELQVTTAHLPALAWTQTAARNLNWEKRLSLRAAE